ncbi:MAG TPA: glycosyltransferase family 2 protein [Anaerolineales bacterium]|nr:glycosyltransferase family 2 protein [Anaerolineales bacterium]
MDNRPAAGLQPPVYIVMLNWNDAPNSLACLESITKLDYSNFNVVIVDNGSTDGSEAQIQNHFPGMHLICNGRNLGFAGGVNVGLEYAYHQGAKYLLLVNNDTLLDPPMLSEMVKAAEGHPQAGLLTPKIFYYHDPTLIWSAGARWVRFPPRAVMIGLRRRDHPRYDVPRRVDFATGCVLMITRKIIDEVGYLDPIYYPIYHEDYDYSARVTEAGWEIWYVPTAKLWHKESKSQRGSGTKAFNLGRNIVPFYLRHGHPPRLSLYLFVSWVIMRETVKGNFAFLGPYLSGVHSGLQSNIKNW